MTTTQAPQLLYGKDGKLYVKKTVGPTENPQFVTILPAREEDIPEPRIAGPSLTLGTGFTKISMRTMLFVHAYFKEIYDRFKAEAIVFFHKDPGSTEYTILVPESFSATAASLTYEHAQPKYCTICHVCSTNEDITTCPRCGTETMARTHIYGTAHSHGSMSAFHSGTDDEHEKGQTGFHITFGNVDKGMFSLCPSFVTALLGYTVNGKGTRHYPELEELVELPSPLTPADRQLIEIWTSTILNEDIARKLSKDCVAVIEKNTSRVVFHGANSSVAERWVSFQGSRRELEIYPIANLLKSKQTRSNRPYRTGANTTQAAEQRRTAEPTGIPVRTTGGARTRVTATGKLPVLIGVPGQNPGEVVKNQTTLPVGGETATGERSTSTLHLQSERVWDIGEFTVTVDHDYDGTEVSRGKSDYIPWPNMLDDQPAEFRFLQVWEVIFIAQQISALIGEIVPKKTGGIDRDVDTALKDLANKLDLCFGTGTAAESIVSEYTNGGTDIEEIVQNSIKCVMREIEGSEYNTEHPLSVLKSIGSLFLINFLVEDLLFWADKHKIINTSIIDDIEEECNNVGNALLKQYTKELEDADGNIPE